MIKGQSRLCPAQSRLLVGQVHQEGFFGPVLWLYCNDHNSFFGFLEFLILLYKTKYFKVPH